MGNNGTVGPQQPATASVAFLVGSSAWGDPFLVQGKKWVEAIQKAAGGAPGVQVSQTQSALGSASPLIDAMSATSATATLSQSTLDSNLGGLRGHSLVIVTHGLDVDDANGKP